MIELVVLKDGYNGDTVLCHPNPISKDSNTAKMMVYGAEWMTKFVSIKELDSSHHIFINESGDFLPMTEETFEKMTGYKPIQDDLERVNCNHAGEIGHKNCGWCLKCNTPAFSCTCTRRV